MKTSLKNATHLSKKVYTKLNNETLHKIENIEISSDMSNVSKLDKTRVLKESSTGPLRDQFKKIFLPLLIDVLELRQSIDNFNLSSCNDLFSKIGKKAKSAEDILSDLENLQEQIEESKRWHDGIICQITRSIQEAKACLVSTQNKDEQEEGWLKKLTKFLKAQ